MLRNFSNKYLFLKKYEVDLWGSLLFVKKASRIFNMVFEMLCLKHKSCIGYLRWHYNRLSWKGSFKYSISMPFKPDIKRRKKFYLWRLHATAVLRVYYGRRRNTKKFKKYIKQFKHKNVNYITRLLLLLETRLDVFLYKLNFFKSPKRSTSFVKRGNIIVNNKIIKKTNIKLYVNDVVCFRNKKKLYKKLMNRIKKKTVIFNAPPYLEMNYNILKCIIITVPKKSDMSFTFKLELNFLRNIV